MTLASGTRLGPYEVTSQIGAGGMGEVYRATDTKLKRQVALKVLPPSVAADHDRLARFQREAEVLAALNHPNIASIHGLEESAGTTALVMELVEGEDLSTILARGPMPLAEALPIAKQIADALEAAHEQGIIHRDLKPANIKVRADGTVKVLDFGLAKALGPPGAASGGGSSVSMSPTLTTPAMTQMGMILGTAAYMAPEQAKGRAVDRRADVWAFGAVLYEMLSGHRAFVSEDVSDTLANVLKTEPEWDRLPAETPPRVRLAVGACLQKDPKQRLGDMQSVRLALEGAFETAAAADAAQSVPSAPRSAMARVLPWAVAAALGVALGIAMWAPWRTGTPADRPMVRANLDVPGYDNRELGDLALSPDGTRIAYVKRGEDGKNRLATRLLAEREWKVLAGTEGAYLPFFSPDGQWIGFGAENGQLKKVLALGGAPLKLADTPAFWGAGWSENGFIVATVNVLGPLMRIPEAGGTGEVLLSPSETPILPQVLPGGTTVIFGGSDAQGPAVKMLSLDTKHVSTLIPGAPWARYLPTHGTANGATGHLVYPNGNTLLAAPFDPGAGAVRGPAMPVLDDVAGPIGFSRTGEVLYQSGVASGAGGWSLGWMLPDGKTEPLLKAEARYIEPRVSPDGSLLAVTVDADRPAEAQLLVYDWRNDRTLALTEKGQMSGGAVWTPDSLAVIWATPRTKGKIRFVWRRADGSGDARTLVESSTFLVPEAISPDGRYLALMADGGPETKADLLVAPLDLSKPGEMSLGEAAPLVRLPGIEVAPVFSPDGRWVAYFSDESGPYNVYVQRFPGGGGHRQVSEGGGIYPRWSPNGRQLLYIGYNTGNRLMALDYQGNGDAFVAGKPREWSPTPIRRFSSDDYWDLDPKGNRAVVVPAQAAPGNAGPPKLAYLLHFFDELRRKAPVGK